MNIEDYIQDLNTRATNLWVPKHALDREVVAVCIFISPKGRSFQAWLSHWNIKGVISTHFDSFISVGTSLEESLSGLDTFISNSEMTAAANIKDGERIVDQIGFTD